MDKNGEYKDKGQEPQVGYRIRPPSLFAHPFKQKPQVQFHHQPASTMKFFKALTLLPFALINALPTAEPATSLSIDLNAIDGLAILGDLIHSGPQPSFPLTNPSP